MEGTEQSGAADVEEAVEHVEEAVEHVEDTVEDVAQSGADVPADVLAKLVEVATETRDAVRELGKHLIGDVSGAAEHVEEAAADVEQAGEEAAVAAPDAVENTGATVEKGIITKLHETFG